MWRCLFWKEKKKKNIFPYPRRVLQPIEAVEKRLSLRTDKVKKDHNAQEQQDAAEEWFPKAAHTSPVTYDIRNCQLTPYLQFKGSCCVAQACCSAVSWSLCRCRTGIPASSGQTLLLWEACSHPTAPRGNTETKTKKTKTNQEIRDRKHKGTFTGNKLSGSLLLRTKGPLQGINYLEASCVFPALRDVRFTHLRFF